MSSGNNPADKTTTEDKGKTIGHYNIGNFKMSLQ